MNLNFLIRMHATNQSTSDAQELLNMLRHTMDKMAAGGINDHVCKVRKPEVYAFQDKFWRHPVRRSINVSNTAKFLESQTVTPRQRFWVGTYIDSSR